MEIKLTERKKCPYCGLNKWTVKYYLGDYNVCICTSCSGVFHNPYVVEGEAEKIFSSTAFRKLINPETKLYYDREFVDKNAKHTFEVFDWLLDKLESETGIGKLLDVGFGMALFLRRAVLRGWDVLGIDFSSEYCRYAKEKLNLKVVESGFWQFKCLNEEFNVVVMWDVIEHLDEPIKYLRKVYRILKKNGVFAIAVPNEQSLLGDIASLIYRVSFGKIKAPLRSVYIMEHPLFFNVTVLSNLLKKCGFKVILSMQNETDLDRLNLGGLKNIIVRNIFKVARVLRRQNRIIILAKKESSS